MSKYTTELRYPLEQRFNELNPDYEGTPEPRDVCVEGKDIIFDFYYPINPDDKERFEINFCLHYYTREIGSETLALFKLRLQSKLNELIPKYNMLWNQLAEMSEINIYDNVDLQTIRNYGQVMTDDGKLTKTGSEKLDHGHTITKSGDKSQEYENFSEVTENKRRGTDTTTNTPQGKTKTTDSVVERVSDTPMGTIENMSDVHNNMYLSAAKITDNTNTVEYLDNRKDIDKTEYDSAFTTTRTPTGKQKEVYNDLKEEHGGTDTTTYENRKDENYLHREYGGKDIETVKGKNGGKSYAEEMEKARKLFINIDQMLINELRNLFMLIW